MTIPKTTKGLLDSPHGRPAADVLAALEVSVITGLSEHEAGRRLQHYGPNTIGGRQRVGAFAILVHQCQSLVVGLLAVAAGLAFYFGEWEEGSAIAGVLVLNTLIGFVTEIKAVRSIEALRVLGTRSARVCRDGRTRLVPAERLVPGDIVLLDAGDVITADLRLVEASNLEVDESTLTGESMGVGKTIAPVDVNARVSDRSSMLFKGTSITRGNGIGVVVATGMDTELGHISRLVEEAEPETSPLEKKLVRLSGQLVWVTLYPDCADWRHWPGAGQRCVPHGRGRNCTCDRGDPRRAADRGNARTRTRYVAHGATECADRAPVGSRDPRCHDGDPHRQDRNPHGKPHDGPEGVASIGGIRRRKEWV